MGASDVFVTSNGNLTENTINILLNFEIEEVGSICGCKSLNSPSQKIVSGLLSVSQNFLWKITALSS